MSNRIRALCLAAIAASAVFAQEKEKPPAGGAPKPFTVPATETTTLKNGMRVTLAPYGEVPKVTVRAIVRAGNANEAADQVWLADVLGELMKEGAGSKNAEQVALEAARMGGQLTIGVGEDQTQVNGDVLSEFAADMVNLVADVLQRPALPASELERIKNNRLRQLAVFKSTPQNLANEALRKVLYKDHPYGRYFPTEEMLKSYTIEDARKFYQANFGAGRTHLYVAGKFDRSVMKTIMKAFEGWERGPAPAVNIPKTAPAKSVTVIERPNAPQSTLRLAVPVLHPKDPDYVPFVVTNALLGGSFMSRIVQNIREQKGYTYSPNSSISTRYRDGYWVQNADVTTAVTGAAIKEIVGEIERLRKEPPPPDELQGIQNYLAGTFVLQNSSRQGIIGQLNFVELHDLGANYLKTYVQKVHAVTPADVQKIMEKYLDPNKMALVVVGDKAKIAGQLEPFQTEGDSSK